MSLCNVCSSIPFRKLITPESAAAGVEDDFIFNAAGRAPSVAWDDLAWNERRCTIAEVVSRAKTCPLCAYMLLLIKQERWELCERDIFFEWEEVKNYIPRNLMVWLKLCKKDYSYSRLEISIGNPRRRVTTGLSLFLRFTFGNPNSHQDTSMQD